jgi:hypothetical protein
MADGVEIAMFTEAPLRSRATLSRLLAAFEREPRLVPSHWWCSSDRRPKPWSVAALARFVEARTELLEHVIARRKPIRFSARLIATDVGIDSLVLETPKCSDADLARLFALAGVIAEAIEPVFGCVHPYWRLGARDWKSAPANAREYFLSGLSPHGPEKFRHAGPRGLAARTWLGDRLVRLIGRQRLVAAGCIVEDTAWGGLRVDLVEAPARAGLTALASQQKKAMRALARTGVFGDYRISALPKPGACWKMLGKKPAPPKKKAKPRIEVPGTIESIEKELARARTRRARHAALEAARLAAEKGRDVASLVPVLGKYLSEGFAPEAMAVLARAADAGVDVLSPRAKGGMEIWETVKLLFEHQGLHSEAIRHAGILLVEAAARRRLPHVSYFLPNVEDAAADTRMEESFVADAKRCLAVLKRVTRRGESRARMRRATDSRAEE